MAVRTLNQGVQGLNMSPNYYYDMFGEEIGPLVGGGNAFAELLFGETPLSKQEKFYNNEVAQNNQLLRDLYFQEQANMFNAQEAQKQRDFEERMSSSAYQRAMDDLRKAGLNPILAYSSPSSTPSGASASSSSGRSSSSNNNSVRRYGVLSTFLMALAGLLSK